MKKIIKTKRGSSKVLALFTFLFLVLCITPLDALAGWKLEVPIPLMGGGEVELPAYVKGIYRFAAGAVGIVGVLMFMIGGFQYMIAAGNKGMAGEARKTMTNAIIGIIMVVAAFLFLRTINTELVNLKSLQFN